MNIPRLFGVPRSGGTLIYNIVKNLYEPGLVSTQKHKYFNHGWREHRGWAKTEKAIVIYRDFRDSIVSQWRVMTGGFDEEKDAIMMSPQEVTSHAVGQLDMVKVLDRFKEDALDGRQVLFLKYEDFFISETSTVNFDFIFSELETFLDIKISQETRGQLTKECSFKNQKKQSKRFEDFHSWDNETHVHGNHLYTGKCGTWRVLGGPYGEAIFNKILGDALYRWGYI